MGVIRPRIIRDLFSFKVLLSMPGIDIDSTERFLLLVANHAGLRPTEHPAAYKVTISLAQMGHIS